MLNGKTDVLFLTNFQCAPYGGTWGYYICHWVSILWSCELSCSVYIRKWCMMFHRKFHSDVSNSLVAIVKIHELLGQPSYRHSDTFTQNTPSRGLVIEFPHSAFIYNVYARMRLAMFNACVHVFYNETQICLKPSRTSISSSKICASSHLPLWYICINWENKDKVGPRVSRHELLLVCEATSKLIHITNFNQ